MYAKNQGGSYEVAFIPALWMVFSESLKKAVSELICTRLYGRFIVPYCSRLTVGKIENQ